MNDKLKRFIECLIPVTACNIQCGYCYVAQRNNRKMKMPKMKYSIDQIGAALSRERWGGTCYFSVCGAGETLLPHETIEIVFEMLKNGHFVNITTNGTLTMRFDEIISKFPKEYLERLHFAFSFHYNELKRINKIDEFFNNILRVRKAGCSFIVQLNLCDEYIPYLEDIKNICLEKVGSYPQVAATRKEKSLNNNVQFMTELSQEEYYRMGQSFDSPLFEFTMKNFNVSRHEFCYAGDWAVQLDLSTGVFSRCYGSCYTQDIFADPKEPIQFQAMGNKCNSLFCMNSSHFMSLGVIPEIDTPTYAELRNRKNSNWYSDRMNEFLNQKLSDNNELYNTNRILMSIKFARKERHVEIIGIVKQFIKKTVKIMLLQGEK